MKIKHALLCLEHRKIPNLHTLHLQCLDSQSQQSFLVQRWLYLIKTESNVARMEENPFLKLY